MSRKVSCYKVKKGEKTRMRKCDSATINKMVDQGFSVSKVVEMGNKTKITTFSPLTRAQALREHRKIRGILPF